MTKTPLPVHRLNASAVWSPYTKENINELEKVQGSQMGLKWLLYI